MKDGSVNIFDLVGTFTWSFGSKFYIETSEGNFVWSDPDYRGDHTIREVKYSYKEWCRVEKIPYGRDKGKHILRNFCKDEHGNMPRIVK